MEVSQSLVTKFLRGETGLSFSQADDIAKKLKTTLLDMLIEGQKILDGVPDSSGLTHEQEEIVDALKFCLKEGGEGIEIITKAIIDLEQRKQTEAGLLNPPSNGILSKSA